MVQREKQKESRELQQAKMELAAAHDAGEAMLLREVALRYPAQLETLTDFVAGLYATDVDEQEMALPVTADVEAVTLRARQRALSAVFSVSSAAASSAQAASTLAQVRKASGLSLVELAGRVALGVDVVKKLEQGRITAASVPQRLVDRLAETLAVSKEHIWSMLRSAPGTSIQPALLRQRPVRKANQPESQPPQEQAFAEAVQLSLSMTAEQRTFWLEEHPQD
jgi:transcriptional regulator with XRE-family HTH domain